MQLIDRQLEVELRKAAGMYPVVSVVGPRQSGKTTLVKAVFAEKAYVSLENPDVRAYAVEDPRGFLNQHREGAVFDEVQRVPDLLSYLQEMVDTDRRPGRFILTGSQHFLMMREVSNGVIRISLFEGLRSPDGWLWAKMTAAA